MPKRPRDPSELAKQVFDIAIGEAVDTVSDSKRNPPPQRKGGLKGGQARAAKLSKKQRSEIAKLAASVRWKKRKG